MDPARRASIALQASYFGFMAAERALRAFMSLSLLTRALWVLAAIQALGMILRATG
jgi:hypothetical protein